MMGLVKGVGAQILLREIRQNSFRLLWAALFLAVFIVATITSFTARLEATFTEGAARFMGGDQLIESTRSIPDAFRSEAQKAGLELATSLEFATMLSVQDDLQLVSVKAVDEGYPLKSRISIADVRGGSIKALQRGPAPGEVWLVDRLFPLLNVAVGDYVQIGRTKFRIGAVLLREPDPSFSLVNVAPRVMMSFADVPSTGVVQPGSRLKYRLLMKGDPEQLDGFNKSIEPMLTPSERLIYARTSGSAVNSAIDRSERYLLLGGCLGVLLAAVALTLAAQHYTAQQKETVALLKTLGATRQILLVRYGSMLVFLAISATFAGLIGGFLTQQLLMFLLAGIFPPLSQPIGLSWVVMPIVTTVIVLASFAWPVFRLLLNETPMSILRQAITSDSYRRLGFTWFRILSAGIGLFVLLYAFSGNWRMALAVIGGLLSMLVVGGALMFAWVRLRPADSTIVPNAWHAGFAQVKRRYWSSLPQILALGSAWTLLLVLYLVRTELIDSWQAQVPKEAPNHFLINIASYEVEPLQKMLDEASLDAAPLYPMVRGRLTHINDSPVRQTVSKEREVEALNRELNLTWAANLPEDNRLLKGAWWPKSTDGAEVESGEGVSVESQLAGRLNIDLGDALRFQIGDRIIDSEVTSIREVQWDSLKPNFYMMFQPGKLADYSATYMTSIYIPKEDKAFVNELNKLFPTVSVLELEQFVSKIRELIAQVSYAIEALLALILLAAFLVIASLLLREAKLRRQETALYRSFGAERKVVVRATMAEFAIIGALAGIFAVVTAESVSGYLQHRLFGMPPNLHPYLWILAPSLSAALTSSYAFVLLRKVLNSPPHLTLQSGVAG